MKTAESNYGIRWRRLSHWSRPAHRSAYAKDFLITRSVTEQTGAVASQGIPTLARAMKVAADMKSTRPEGYLLAPSKINLVQLDNDGSEPQANRRCWSIAPR